jgi:hypothetical protein
MTNAELMTNSQRSAALSPEHWDVANIGCARVERVVLNALRKTAALPPNIRAFGDQTPIVFGEAAPPWARCPYLLTRQLVGHCFRLRHLVIPSSLDIRHSSFSRHISVPRHGKVA